MGEDPNTPPTPGYGGRGQPPYGPGAPAGWGGQYEPPTQPYPGPGGGYGGQGGEYGETPPQYPGGRPPQWPGPGYDVPPSPPPPQPTYPQREYPPDQSQQYPRRYDAQQQARAYAPEAAYAPPRVQRREPAERHRRALTGVALPHLPIAHVLLAIGLVAMGYALTQQWGVNTSGNAIFVKDFTSPQVQHLTGFDTGVAASKLGVGIVIAAAVLSAALVLFNLVVTVLNKVLHVVGLPGCATLLFFPVLWGAATLLFLVLVVAAGFAGLGFLSGLPIVQAHGFSTLTIAHYSLGWYLWLGGIGAVFLGMLGQLVLRRR
jgi:hypothetical protein